MTKKNSLSRRKFISNAAVIGAAGTFGAKNFAVLFASEPNKTGENTDSHSTRASVIAPADTFWFYSRHTLGRSCLQNKGAIS